MPKHLNYFEPDPFSLDRNCEEDLDFILGYCYVLARLVLALVITEDTDDQNAANAK